MNKRARAKTKLLEKNKDTVIEMFLNKETLNDIANHFNCSRPTVTQFLKDNGYNKRPSLHLTDLSEHADDIINRFEGGESIYSISRSLSFGDNCINRFLKDRGYDVNKGHRSHPDGELGEHKDEIIRIYLEEKIGIELIAKRFNTFGTSIRKIINRAGVMRSYDYYRYNVNENYFEKIDTRNKSYILGFLMADGSVHNRCWKMRLQLRDKLILDKIKEEVEYEGPIFQLPPKQHIDKRTGKVVNNNGSYVLSIVKVKMVQDLIKLGCVPNKTWLGRFPTAEQVPREFLADYLRGYYDGDGHITTGATGLSVIGNHHFISELYKHLPLKKEPRFYFNQSVQYPDDADKKTLTCDIGVKHGARDVLRFLYGDCADSLYLPRKRDLALYWLDKSRGKK